MINSTLAQGCNILMLVHRKKHKGTENLPPTNAPAIGVKLE